MILWDYGCACGYDPRQPLEDVASLCGRVPLHTGVMLPSRPAPLVAPRLRVVLTLAVFAGLTAWALIVGGSVRPPVPQDDSEPTDLGLYEAIADRVADGAGYYRAAVAEQLAQGYPVEPGTTVRLPTTTYVNALLGETGAHVLLLALLAFVMLAVLRQFETVMASRIAWIGGSLLVGAGLVMTAGTGATYFSESWAVLLLVASLAVGVERHERWALLLACLAMTFRELALLPVAAMALFLWLRGRRRLCLQWAAAAVVFLLAYATIHLQLVASAVDAAGAVGDHSSPGWIRFGGWPLVVDFVRRVTPLMALPYWCAAVIVTAAGLGWALARDSRAQAWGVVAAAFAVPFMVVGRPDNAYWGLLLAAVILPGLALVPSAARRLTADLAQRQSESMTPEKPA